MQKLHYEQTQLVQNQACVLKSVCIHILNSKQYASIILLLPYRPYVAPPLFSTALFVFRLLFAFPQHESKVVRSSE